MTIDAGTRLGPYEIVALIGAGGMGEVYKARDTRLERSVAVKILPAEFATNARLRLRFEREAKTISQLSHPNICALFDVGENYLVMELLEGESLAARIARGPLPLSDVLKYGTQIAEALGTAHREGVIHRDLKPANVMITKAGAKLLDFGLAKTVRPMTAVNSATEQRPLTQEGAIVGTFQYMAPEQLGGEEPDTRTDIFAFGAVLYEMVTGRRAFEGKSNVSLMEAIVSGEPAPVASLQPLTPPALEHVIRKCLSKDRDDRWQSASDIAETLRWIGEAGSQASPAQPSAPRRQTRERLAWSLAVLLLITTAAAGVLAWRSGSPKPQLMRFSIPLPPNTDAFAFHRGGIALSPDGLRVAFSLRTRGIGRQLWIRSLDSAEAVAVPETIGASFPFWSPDGRYVAFFSQGKLRKVPANGGPPQVICDAPSGRGGSWNENGTIVFSPDIYSPLERVSSAGGAAVAVTSFDRNRDVTQRWPVSLPDGQHFLFVGRTKTPDGAEQSALYGASLTSPAITRIVADASNAAFMPPGLLLFSRAGSLMAVRFDPKTLRTSGEAAALTVGKAGYYPGSDFSFFAAAPNGTLVFLPPHLPVTQMRWLDREGRAFGAEEQPGFYVAGSVSPDGKRLAFSRTDDGTLEHADIWLHDIGTANSSRFTFDGDHGVMRWSSDGKKLFYTSTRDLYVRSIEGGGKAEPVCVTPRFKETFDVTPDGKWLLVSEQFEGTNWDLMLVSLADHSVKEFLRTPADDWMPAFSPDGRWVAFVSGTQIVVRRFPDTGEQWQISTAGGTDPKWSSDGKRIYYTGAEGTVSEVAVRAGSSFSFDPPRPLFDTDPHSMPEALYTPLVAVSGDAQRFLVVTRTESREIPFQVVLNWPQMIAGK